MGIRQGLTSHPHGCTLGSVQLIAQKSRSQ